MESVDQRIIVGALGAAAFGAGVATGYFTAKKKLKKLYADLAEQEIKEAKEYYSVINKKGEYSDPVALAEAVDPKLNDPIFKQTVNKYHNLVNQQAYREQLGIDPEVAQTPAEKMEVEQSLDKNIFDQAASMDEVWSYEVEMENRKNETIFIIHKDEFDQNEMDHENTSVTYYDGDNVLADEKDGMIENEALVVGQNNLQFGHGSQDVNIVYIRNLDLETDFEVVRSPGAFGQEVLGFLEHSSSPRHARKFG